VGGLLAGTCEGEAVGDFGFGTGSRGGPRGGGGGDFGPGMFLGNVFMQSMDTDKDGALTREEFVRGFQKWFDQWDTTKSGTLSEEQLRTGINEHLLPPGFGPPGPDRGP